MDNKLIFNKDEPVTNIIGQIFKTVFKNNADGVQIAPSEKGAEISCSVGQSIVSLATVSPEMLENIVSRIKIMAGLKLGEKSKQQEGSFPVTISDQDKTAKANVSTAPTQYGENISIKFSDIGPIVQSTTTKEFVRDNLSNL